MSEIKNVTTRHGYAFVSSHAESARYYLWRGVIYLLAVVVPLLVLWMRMSLSFPLDQHRMLVLFVPTILLMAQFGGLGPAIVATVSTAIVSNLFILPPFGQLSIAMPDDALQWTVLILSGVMAAVIGEIQRRSRQRMIDGQRQLMAAYELLQKSEERLRMAGQGACVGVWEFDIASGGLWMSPECAALYGVTPGALRDHAQWRARIHPDDWGLVDAQLAAGLQGALINAEFRVCWPDGSVHWLYARGSADHDGDGRVLKLTGIDQDITLRKQAEQELSRVSERNRLFLRHASDGIHILDAEGNLIEVSDVFCAMLGYAREELLGMHVSRWDAQFTDSELCARIRQELDHPRRWTFETRHRRRDGSLFDAEITCTAIDLGEQRVLFTSSRDITARNLAEAQLRDREQMLAESQRIARIGSWRWDLEGPIFWSDESYRIYGVDPESFQPTVESLLELVPPEDRQILRDWITDCASGKPVSDFTFRLIRTDGSIRHLRGRGELIRNADGTPQQMIGTVQDITDQVNLTAALRTSEQEFRLLAEAMPQIVWVTRADGWNIYFNRQWVDYTGLTLEQSHGHGWNIPFHPDDQKRAWDAWRNAVEHNATYALECRLRRFDGSYRWWLIRGVPVVDDAGTILKWFGTCTDIEEIKQREAALRASEERRQFALETLGAGEWELNLNTHTAVRSHLHDRIFGYEQLLAEWTYETFLQHVVPEDRARVDYSFRQAQQDRTRWDFECRICRASGDIRWIHACGSPRTSESGETSFVGILRDITAQKLASEELERMRLLMAEGERIAQLGTWEFVAASGTTHWSAEEYRIYGLDPDGPSPLYDTMLRDCIHPDDAERLDREFRRALSQSAPFELEHRIVRPDGSVREVRDLAQPFFDEAGTLIKYIGVTLDITEQKKKDRLLRDRETRLRALLEGAQDGILLAELPSRGFVEANPAICRMLGYTREEMLTMTPFNIHTPADLPRVMEIFERMGRGEIIFGEDIPLLRKNGSVFPCDVSATLLEIDNTAYLAGFFRDITVRKQTEQELEAYRQHLEELVFKRTEELQDAKEEAEDANRQLVLAKTELERTLESIGQGFVVLDAEWRYTFVNVRAEQMLGMAREEIIGKCIWDIFPDTVGTLLETNYRRAAEGTLVEFENFYAPWNRWFQLSCFPREGGGISVYFADVTDIKNAANELEKAKDRAESANRAKSEFLANMSHEIRTPLNAILGFTHLLQQGLADATALQQVGKIRAAGRSLLGLINDLLDFSKIEAGQLPLEHTPFRLLNVLDNLASLLSGYPDKPDLEIVLLPAAGVPGLIGDALRLEQVLLNLLSNAHKFTPSGVVVLDVTCLDSTDRTVTLRFSVRDTGIGISAERQGEIFGAFTQADATTTRHYGGTGLGLAIASRLVTLMGGELTVTSTPGQGSEFCFTLTLERDVMPDRTPLEPASLHVLGVDSHPQGLEALRRCGAVLGWDVSTAASPAEALSVIDQRRRENSPLDLVVLDGRMLNERGLALLTAIGETRLNVASPIVLLLGSPGFLMNWRNHPVATRIDGWLTKPITPSTLGEVVQHTRRHADSNETPDGGDHALDATLPLAGVRVLVVDDSDINRDLAETLLTQAGATVVTAEDGWSALDWLEHHADQLDVVLLDVQMPGLDGHEVTRRYRELKGDRQLPIIALSAGAYSEQREAALAAGMDDYLAKPFEVEQLLDLVRQHAKRSAEPARGFDGPAPKATPAPITAELPGLAVAEALKVWNDPAIYRRYLQKFVATYGGSAEAMAAMLAQGQAADTSAAAHKLAGAAGSLGLTAVGRCARELETAALANEAVARAGVAALRDALAVAVASIAAYGNEPAEAESGGP